MILDILVKEPKYFLWRIISQEKILEQDANKEEILTI